MFLFLIASLLTLVPCSYSTKECDFWGTFCRPDLSGYRKCGIRDFGYVLEKEVTCPQGTRCSCFLGNDCSAVQHDGYSPHDMGIKDEDICQPLPSPYPVKKVLHLAYKKGGWWEWDPDEDYAYFDEEGDIKQDLRAQKILQTWGNVNARKFKLIVPDSDGIFVKFTGQYPDECKVERTSKSEEFGTEFKHYRLKSSEKLKNGLEKQVWYNQVFRIDDDDGQTNTWTVISDPVEKHVVPVRYRDSYYATREEYCCSHHVHVTYKEVYVDPTADVDGWFTIPHFCL